MTTRLTLVLPLAALIGAGIAPASDRPERPERESAVAAAPADVDVDAGLPGPEAEAEAPAAACYINLSARNNSRDDVYLRLADSKVRMRRGWWARFEKWRSVDLGIGVFVSLSVPNPPIEPGERVKTTVKVSHGCNALRRYRFHLRSEDGASHVIYYPSSRRYTRRTNIDLGDISRFF